MTGHSNITPRERLDARAGWRGITVDGHPQTAGLVAMNDRLVLANATLGPEGLVFDQPIPDAEAWGSMGGRVLPRGLAISEQGDVYLADPARARVLYTRASLPPPSDPDDAFAPFVPLWRLAEEAPHPLGLHHPVDLALVAGDAPLGAMADALVIADAGPAPRLLWLDRRHVLLRHDLALPASPIAVGVSAAGLVRVVIAQGSAAQLLTLRAGAVLRADPLDRVPHALHVQPDGLAVLADATGLWALDLAGRPAALPQLLTPAALQPAASGLDWPNGCAHRDPVHFAALHTDRRGALNGTGLPLVTLPRRLPRPRRGTWIAGPFDGEARGFAWHRIGLDAEVPDQCRLLLTTHVSDFATAPDAATDWGRGIEITATALPEALIQRNKGRFLWLRLEAFGNGTDTPAISGIDIFGPRQSQLDLLPAPFREDAETADFLDRFLSLQDQFMAEALASFDRMGAILRPVATPPEFLDWLGGWFDWQFLAEWDQTTRREMIAASMQFFAQRGTIAGLARMLRWHLGAAGRFPVLLENYRLMDWLATPLPDGGAASLWIGGLAQNLTSGAHEFTVILPQALGRTEAARAQIERIITAQRPAHTTHRTLYVAAECRLGEQGLLGIDAILPQSRPPPLGAGKLGDSLSTTAAC